MRGVVAAVGVRELALAGALPNTQGGRDLLVGREAAIAAPPLAHHSTIVLFFYGGRGFLHKHF